MPTTLPIYAAAPHWDDLYASILWAALGLCLNAAAWSCGLGSDSLIGLANAGG